jgi:hypothetical protein
MNIAKILTGEIYVDYQEIKNPACAGLNLLRGLFLFFSFYLVDD